MKKIGLFILAGLFSISAFSQIPILNSNPSISGKVIYLDFDGQVVSGTLWNSGNTINAVASTATATKIVSIWNRVSEDYRPFDVNVTTDSVRFKNANPTSRIRVVFTGTSSWYGSAGGVAYLGSFAWGGYPGTPCWVFENQLNYSTKSMAEAAAHEVGHTLSLYHQSTYNSSCAKTAEYNAGTGSGVVSWAPIMGVGYNRNVTIWHNGTNANGCTTYQFDHGSSNPGITGISYLSFLPDDIGNTFSNAKILNLNSTSLLDSGLITTPTDVDLYAFTICNSRYVSFNVKPWSLDTNATGYVGADLDVKIKLYNSSGTMIAADSTNSRLFGLLGQTLNPGTYYLGVDGGSSTLYSDYGSLGKYYLRVKSLNPPQLTNTIVLPNSVCLNQAVTFSAASNGTPGNWQWIISGPVNGTYTVPNPTFTFNTAGIYSISLLANNTSSASCEVTRTLNITPSPTLNISGTQTILCQPLNGVLAASGANSYTWMPGSFWSASLIVTPSLTTTYTLIGKTGSCFNSAVSTLTVGPVVNFSVSATSKTICLGNSSTISATGASAYTINPGNFNNSSIVVTPTFNTNYSITASNGTCIKTGYLLIKVEQPYSASVSASDIYVCPGQSLTLSGSGAATYTFNPGNITGPVAVVSPTATTNYTMLALSANLCPDDTSILITVIPCNMTGLSNTRHPLQVNIYPNPAHDNFTLINESGELHLIIFSIEGGKVYEKNIRQSNTETINTQKWARGLYFVSLESSDGQNRKLFKLALE